MPAQICGCLRRHATLFWDFDGVIKESVGIKTVAFGKLFEPFGAAIAARVREHHERNGGVTRLRKIPLYLQWAGVTASDSEVARYCEAFSGLVRQAVIDSAWVPGAREYLQENHRRQQFVLITATPQGEIEDILRALGIASWFQEVRGAPGSKREAIASCLGRQARAPGEALVIGDSESDFEAARAAGVEFVLRRTALNRDLQSRHLGLQCEDFLE